MIESKYGHFLDQNSLVALQGLGSKRTSSAADNHHHYLTDVSLREVVEQCCVIVEKALRALEERVNEFEGGGYGPRANGPSSLLTPARPTPANAFVAAMTVHSGGSGNTPGTAGTLHFKLHLYPHQLSLNCIKYLLCMR